MTTEFYRVDKGNIQQSRKDHNGNLLVSGRLTRTGVFKYRHADGSVTHELRHPDDVFDASSVASFVQVPVTDEHPTEGRVTTKNSKRLLVGNVGDSIERDGDFVKANLTIRDSDTIDKIMGLNNSPKRELSCGYKATVIPEVGTYKGDKYDHRQTAITGNHVAIVAKGRAGPEARFLIDSAEGDSAWVDSADGDFDSAWVDYADDINEKVITKPKGENKVPTNDDKIDTVTIEYNLVDADGQRTDSIDKLTLVSDSESSGRKLINGYYDKSKELKSAQDKVDALESEVASLTVERDDALTTPAEQAAWTQERVDVLDTAKIVNIKLDGLEEKTTSDLKRLIVDGSDIELKADASDEYIDGCYNAIKAGGKLTAENKKRNDNLGAITGKETTDAERADANKEPTTIRQASLDKLKGAENKTDAELKSAGLN